MYIKLAGNFVADHAELGVIYPDVTDNPFPWMIEIGLWNLTNFFERRVTEYNHASTTEIDWSFNPVV